MFVLFASEVTFLDFYATSRQFSVCVCKTSIENLILFHFISVWDCKAKTYLKLDLYAVGTMVITVRMRALFLIIESISVTVEH